MTSGTSALTVGASLGTTRFGPITQTDIVRYQGASGDFQPIHHDPEFVARAGLERPLVIGMLPAGLVAGWLTQRFGAGNVRYFSVRWQAPVWLGDVLTAAATVAGRHADAEGEKVDVDVACTRQTGEAALSCKLTFLVPP